MNPRHVYNDLIDNPNYCHLVIDGPSAFEGISYREEQSMNNDIAELHPDCKILYKGYDYKEALKCYKEGYYLDKKPTIPPIVQIKEGEIYPMVNNKRIKIRIHKNSYNNFVPQRRFLFFWYNVSEFDFVYKPACLKWLKEHYLPSIGKGDGTIYSLDETFLIK